MLLVGLSCGLAVSHAQTTNGKHSLTTNYYDAKTKLKFGLYNDSVNLYVALQSYDDATQFQIFRAGMSVSLKMAIEPKTTAKFTIQPIRVDDILQFEQSDPILVLKERVLLNKPVMEIKGLLSSDKTVLLPDTSLVMHYTVSWNEDNAMLLVFQIPLKELFDSNVKKTDVYKKDNLLTVILNGIEHQGEMPREPQQQQRPTSLSQGGFGREGLNPERQFGTSFDNSFSTMISETTTLRHKFKLK